MAAASSNGLHPGLEPRLGELCRAAGERAAEELLASIRAEAVAANGGKSGDVDEGEGPTMKELADR